MFPRKGNNIFISREYSLNTQTHFKHGVPLFHTELIKASSLKKKMAHSKGQFIKGSIYTVVEKNNKNQ